MSNFVDRLLILVADKEGGKHTVFAKRAGIQAGTFQNYINGRKPSYDALLNICKTFNVNINWLLTGNGPKYIPANTEGGPCDADPEIAELLEGARRVLKSGNLVAFDALERNIRYFDQAVAAEKRVEELEASQRKLQGDMKNIMEVLAIDKEKMQSSQPKKTSDKKKEGKDSAI